MTTLMTKRKQKLLFKVVAIVLLCFVFIVILRYTYISFRKNNEKKNACTYYSAVYVVANQVDNRKIQIFATKSNSHKQEPKFQNLEVEVVYSKEIIKNTVPLVGSYNQLHNILVMQYACHEYIKKNKEKGQKIISLLAEVSPNTSVSTEGKSISIKKLATMLNVNHSQAVTIMKRNANQWNFMRQDVSNGS